MMKPESEKIQDKKANGNDSSRAGFVLPVILVVALLGVLFGFGRVLLYRFQCQQRIDRQHELEKVYAVRSALRWLQTRKANDLNMVEPETFEMMSFSDRKLEVSVHPVTPIYPREDGDFTITNYFTYGKAEYCVLDDAGFVVAPTNSNYSKMKPTYINESTPSDIMRLGCQMGPGGEETTNWVSRLRVDMEGTGNWMQDVYGRRYMFNARDINKSLSDETSDVVRFYVSPSGKQSAIGLTMYPRNPDEATVADLWFRSEDGIETLVATNVVAGREGNNGKGLQLASDKVTVYHWVINGNNTDIVGTYWFSDTYTIPEDLLYEFTNSTQDVTMTLEVKNGSGISSEGKEGTRNLFNRFLVLPAYEYEVYLKWNDSGVETSELATVVHLIPNGRIVAGAGRNNTLHRTLTYDTHGTSFRGYRIRGKK